MQCAPNFLQLIIYVGVFLPTTTTSVQNATSATISWALQNFSLPVNRYTYSLSRRSSQILCTDTRSVVATNEVSVTFTDLQGFSNYRLTLTAAFDSFGTEESAVTTTDFMTPSAGRLLKSVYYSCCSVVAACSYRHRFHPDAILKPFRSSFR